MKIFTIAIDDEPQALDIIEEYCKEIEFIELRGKFTSPVEALNYILKNNIELIFLDIQMPRLTGFDILKSLKNPPNVIITSAYDNFALQSYEYNVVDYLLKPFSFPRFMNAIEKVVSRHNMPQFLNIQHSEVVHENQYMFIYSEGKFVKIFPDDILYIEAMKDYIKIVTKDSHYIVRDTIKNLEDILNKDKFIRVHRSFIIAFDKISSVEGNQIHIGKSTIPIGKLYKNLFINKINESLI